MQNNERNRERAFLGRHACLAVLEHRPQDVIRLFSSNLRDPELGPFLRILARNRKVYREVSEAELEKIAKSSQHQGIVVIAREVPEFKLIDFEEYFPETPERSLLLYLDGIGNPHNLGAILRTAAHFSVAAVFGDQTGLPQISPAAARTAEGAAELVPLVRLQKPLRELPKLRARGYRVVCAEDRAGAKDLPDFEFPERTILVMGSEVHGPSPELRKLADHFVRIPGSGAVESLNVSVATAILLAEYSRQSWLKRPEKTRRSRKD